LIDAVKAAFRLLAQGGWTMVPLLAASFLGAAVFLYKVLELRPGLLCSPEEFEDLRELASRGGEVFRSALSGRETMLRRVVRAGVDALPLGLDEAKEAAEEAGRREAARLERGMTALATVATVSPLLGLFGTVLGMVHVFGQVAVAGVGDPKPLAGGISEALVTTVTGLAIAIPALIGHAWLRQRIRGILLTLEERSALLLRIAARHEPGQ